MNIHEYQAKLLLRHYGVPITDFNIVSSMQELKTLIDNLQLDEAVLKVQVHAGGRGKAGGIKIAKNREEILTYGKSLLGMHIVNNQTGPQGVIANQIMVTSKVEIARELYMGVAIDRQRGQASLIISPEGGVDIEETAAHHPEKILTLPITAEGTLRSYNLFRMVKFMAWDNDLAEQGKNIALALAKAFVETDASLIEINPLVETPQKQLIALDVKLTIDEDALFRQPQIASFFDPTQLPKEEIQARANDLAYIALDGDIGCLVNGAGLAMATMDIIHLFGGKPANFLDVGGGASKEKVAEGFKIILADKKVKGILVNIFGGILNCETLAAGIIEAGNELQVNVPLVVRMEGTNVEEGKQMLSKSKLNIILAKNLTDAAEKIMAATR